MYLTQKHFKNALVIAFGLHILLLIIYSINIQLNQTIVAHNPVYVKLGTRPNASQGTTEVNRQTEKIMPTPNIKSIVDQPKEIIPPPKSLEPAVVESVIEPIIQAMERIKAEIPTPAKIEKMADSPKPEKTAPTPQAKPSPPPPLVQHFRPTPMTKDQIPTRTAGEEIPFVQNLQSDKYEVKGISGNKLGNRTQAEQEVITKYEQKLALWLQQNHVYPVEARKQGMEGDAVIRMQIDRLGNVRFYELAERTPYDVLNNAVIKMVQRSDPVPPVPDDYPGDYVIEFLLPVNFKIN